MQSILLRSVLPAADSCALFFGFDYIFAMTKKYERRINRDLSERIEIAIKTRRAFDDLHARRYLELSGVSPALAEKVLSRSVEHLRADIAATSTSQPELPWFPRSKKL